MKVQRPRAYKDRLKGHKDAILSVYSPEGPEGSLLISASADGVIRGWDLKNRSTKFKLEVSRPTSKQEITQYAFLPSKAFVGYSDGEIVSYSLEDTNCFSYFKGHNSSITAIKLTSNLISASRDCTIRVWNIQTQETLNTYRFPSPISDFIIRNDDIIVASMDKMIRVADLSKKTIKDALVVSEAPIKCIDCEGDTVYIGGCEPIIRAWDLQSGTCIELKGHKTWITSIKVHGAYVYSCSDDKSIKVWDKLTGKCLEDFNGHDDGVTCFDFAASMLYSGSFDHSIRSWNIGEMERSIKERVIMFNEDVKSRRIETFTRLMTKKKGKKSKGKGKGCKNN